MQVELFEKIKSVFFFQFERENLFDYLFITYTKKLLSNCSVVHTGKTLLAKNKNFGHHVTITKGLTGSFRSLFVNAIRSKGTIILFKLH